MYIIFNTVVYSLWLIATFSVVFMTLSMLFMKDKLYEKKKGYKKEPMVTLLIPAYNEESSIAKTIEELKKITYKKIEFIILNDGSKDNTSLIVLNHIRGDKRFRFVDNKKNKGKAAVLNEGIELSKGEFVACLDADTLVEKDIIQKVIPYFEDEKVGAVTVSVEVSNKKQSILHKIMAIEFDIGLSLFLKLFSFFDCIFVTPGPFSMYRKKMLKEIGGYDTSNITEDHEIAFRIHKSSYKIKNCMDAKVRTFLPTTFKGLYIQRRRWYAGAIQTLFKHKKMVLNKKYNVFGYYLFLHYLLIFLGFSSFLFTIWLSVSNTIQTLIYYKYVNFDFFHNFRLDFDILRLSQMNILAFSMFIFTIILMVISLKITGRKKSHDLKGLAAFPFIFLLYQLYWSGAFIAVFFSKKIKWK